MVLGAEFGRTPRINDERLVGSARRSVSCLLPGAGIEGGEVTGDTHSDNFEGTPCQAAVLDQAMSALLSNLQATGLLDQTLVVLGTECGRIAHQ